MSIDIEALSPQARRQIEAQLGPGAVKKPRKYHNQPTDRLTPTGETLHFDSQKEARRYDELMLLLQAGKIRGLKLQPQFTLQVSYITPEGEKNGAVRYKADFSYELAVERKVQDGPEHGVVQFKTAIDWFLVVEDVKSRATRTRDYLMKKKLMLEKFGISVQEV